jgi:HD superfamily phosphohydrolase
MPYDLIQHPYFQRCTEFQMGLSYLVYPGANHTRFHHALGYFDAKAVDVLRFKGVFHYHQKKKNALYIAILLHDIGHAPFHAMEKSIVEDAS